MYAVFDACSKKHFSNSQLLILLTIFFFFCKNVFSITQEHYYEHYFGEGTLRRFLLQGKYVMEHALMSDHYKKMTHNIENQTMQQYENTNFIHGLTSQL